MAQTRTRFPDGAKRSHVMVTGDSLPSCRLSDGLIAASASTSSRTVGQTPMHSFMTRLMVPVGSIASVQRGVVVEPTDALEAEGSCCLTDGAAEDGLFGAQHKLSGDVVQR